MKTQVDESSVVAATTATFVPPQLLSNKECVSPNADMRAFVIPDELYLLSVAKDSITSTKRWKIPSDESGKPKNLLPQNARLDKFIN